MIKTNNLLINPALNVSSAQPFEWSQCLVNEMYFFPTVPQQIVLDPSSKNLIKYIIAQYFVV